MDRRYPYGRRMGRPNYVDPHDPPPHEPFWHGDFDPYGDTPGVPGRDPYYGALGYQDHPGVTGPKGYRRPDERIADDLYQRLIRSPHIDSRDVTMSVEGGSVRFAGWVPARHMKHAIEDLALACPGVRDVHNSIRVHRQSGEGEEGRT